MQRGGDYEFMDTEQRYTYYWNSCRGVESRGEPGSEHHCGPYDAVCRNDPDDPNRFFSLGRLETVSFLETRPGFLVAGYQRGTGGRSVAIEIECDRNAEAPRFEITSPPEGSLNYVLIVHSLHGCVQQPPPPPPTPPPPAQNNCTYDAPSGNVYDVRGLVNATSDWQFSDTDGQYDYHWNSCDGLKEDILPNGSEQDCSPGDNGTPKCGCRAGIDAGCQAYQSTEPSEYGPYALGTIESAAWREVDFDPGMPPVLSVAYSNGAESEQYGARSMRVDFQCFEDLEGPPLFRIVSPVAPDMEYRVTVASRHGCPLRDEDMCVLKGEDGTTEYDLRPLVGTTFTADSTETPFDYKYFIGVCSPVTQCAEARGGTHPGDDPRDSASCQVIAEPDPGSEPDTYTFSECTKVGLGCGCCRDH